MCLRLLIEGFTNLGSGWNLIAQIQDYYVEKTHLFTAEELTDMIAISKALPGLLVTNIGYGLGYKMCGPICGFFCVLGVLGAPFIAICLVSLLYAHLPSGEVIDGIMMGVRSAVIPIICFAGYRLGKPAFKKPYHWIIFAIVIVGAVVLKINNILLVAVGAFLGLAFTASAFSKTEKKEGE